MTRAPLEQAERAAEKLWNSAHQVMPTGWALTLIVSARSGDALAHIRTELEDQDAIVMLRQLVTAIESGERSR